MPFPGFPGMFEGVWPDLKAFRVDGCICLGFLSNPRYRCAIDKLLGQENLAKPPKTLQNHHKNILQQKEWNRIKISGKP